LLGDSPLQKKLQQIKTMSTTNTDNWQEKRLGSLWKRESKGGQKYLTGVINLKSQGFDQDVQVVIFSNKTKTKETHPDLVVYVSDKKPTGKEAPAAKSAATRPATKAVPAPAPEPQEPAVDNDLI
jgi:hypothetical protein